MFSANVQAQPNLGIIKYCLAKLGRTNGKTCFGGQTPVKKSVFHWKNGENLIKLTQFQNQTMTSLENII